MEIRGFEGTIIRGLMLIIFGYVYCLKYDKPLTFPEKKLFLILNQRNFLLLIYITAIGMAQFYLPLPIIYTICGSGPIFVFVMDYYVNGISINFKQVIDIMTALVGLILTINGRTLIQLVDPSF